MSTHYKRHYRQHIASRNPDTHFLPPTNPASSPPDFDDLPTPIGLTREQYRHILDPNTPISRHTTNFNHKDPNYKSP